MKKFKIFLIIFFHIYFLSNFESRAESSLEEELKAMRLQMELMQSKLNQLEEKVENQQKEITRQETTKQAYEKRIQDLEEQLAKQKETLPEQKSVGRSAAAKWTPEIGVVGDVVASLDSAKTDNGGLNRVSLRELELVLGSSVDPFSRLDATISFSDTDSPSLEEAYLTRFGLPFDTTARLGKFKPKVGKTIPVHRDSLDTADEPRVIKKYFGTDGFNKSGIDFSKTLNFSWPVTQQVSFGFLQGGNGDDGTAFGTTSRRPTLYSHSKNYLDINDTTGFELGFSHMIGAQDSERDFKVQVLASDVTLTHHFNANQNMKFQGEAFHLNRRETVNLDGNIWGAYGLLDFRFHPQWSAGFRYDYVEPVDNPLNSPEKSDQGYTGYLTFYQSELARWRLQGSHTKLTTGKDDNQIMIQGTFAIGEHKHKLQ